MAENDHKVRYYVGDRRFETGASMAAICKDEGTPLCSECGYCPFCEGHLQWCDNVYE